MSPLVFPATVRSVTAIETEIVGGGERAILHGVMIEAIGRRVTAQFPVSSAEMGSWLVGRQIQITIADPT